LAHKRDEVPWGHNQGVYPIGSPREHPYASTTCVTAAWNTIRLRNTLVTGQAPGGRFLTTIESLGLAPAAFLPASVVPLTRAMVHSGR
jgi:hypothetical protein